MHCPSNLLFKVTAGLILVLFMACDGSGTGLMVNSSAGTPASETGPAHTAGTPGSSSASGGAGAGGTSGQDTGILSSSGQNGGGGGQLMGGSWTGGTASQTSAGGGPPHTGGSQSGASTSAGPGGASITGGSAVAGGTGGASAGATGGATKPGGSTGGSSSVASSASAPRFPARFVGNTDTRGAIRMDFYQHWDQFTPENAGKWPSVQGGSKDTFNWTTLDSMYKYTEEHDIVFKEMCFIWGAGNAAWLNNSNALEAAKTWMTTFCERYPNTRLIDVVNEPLHMTPGFVAGLGGGGRTTWEWVANSFKMARAACPNAVLIINDYNICEYATDHQRFIDLMKAIQAQDAPVDAIGCQGHDAAKIPVSKFKDFMDKLASETGLPIYITEFDIGLVDDEAQRAQYADYFTMFWDDPNVKGATIWGYIMGATWRSNTGIMSAEGTMRPAMSWLMSFLGR